MQRKFSELNICTCYVKFIFIMISLSTNKTSAFQICPCTDQLSQAGSFTFIKTRDNADGNRKVKLHFPVIELYKSHDFLAVAFWWSLVINLYLRMFL